MVSKNNEVVRYEFTEDGNLNSAQHGKKRDTLFLYFAMLTGNLLNVSSGAQFSWTSPALPRLQSNNSDINPLERPVTTMEISIMVGVPYLLGMCGVVVTAPLSDLLGRKRCLQICGLGMLICNLISAYTSKVFILLLSRIIFALFGPSAFTLVQIYCTEVCEDHNRAKYGCLIGFSLPLGGLYICAIGPYLSVRDFTLVSSIPLILFLIFSYFLPETPIFCLLLGKKKECVQILKKLRSNKNSKEIEEDLNMFDRIIEDNREHNKNNKKVGYLTLFETRRVRISMLVVAIPTMLAYFSGAPLLVPFIAPVFNKTHGYFSGDSIATISGAVQCVCFSIASWLVTKVDRKLLLFLSAAIVSSMMFILGVFFYLNDKGSPLVDQFGYVAPIAFVILIVAYSFGLGPIPTSFISEMFTPDVRATGTSFIMVLLGISTSFLLISFPIVSNSLGVCWCFWIFGFNAFWGAIFIFTIIPRTKGKSLIELQQIMDTYKFNLKWNK